MRQLVDKSRNRQRDQSRLEINRNLRFCVKNFEIDFTFLEKLFNIGMGWLHVVLKPINYLYIWFRNCIEKNASRRHSNLQQRKILHIQNIRDKICKIYDKFRVNPSKLRTAHLQPARWMVVFFENEFAHTRTHTHRHTDQIIVYIFIRVCMQRKEQKQNHFKRTTKADN